MTDWSIIWELVIDYLRPTVEILLLSLLIYIALYYMRGTRGVNILAGLILILILMTLASVALKFEVIAWMLKGFWTIFAITLIVIFQPELRRAFAQLGSPLMFQHRSRREEAIVEVVSAVLNMSRQKTGAIIVFERKIGMRAIVEDSVKLDCRLDSFLLESIFYPNSPLHDGAIIVRDGRIVAARCILPLSRNEELLRNLGTRHRAAVGITEETDAVAVVVSEETGIISIACQGSIRRNIQAGKLRRYLVSLVISREDEIIKDVFGSLDDK